MNKLDLPAILKQAEAATNGEGWFWNGYDAIWAGKGDFHDIISLRLAI